MGARGSEYDYWVGPSPQAPSEDALERGRRLAALLDEITKLPLPDVGTFERVLRTRFRQVVPIGMGAMWVKFEFEVGVEPFAVGEFRLRDDGVGLLIVNADRADPTFLTDLALKETLGRPHNIQHSWNVPPEGLTHYRYQSREVCVGVTFTSRSHQLDSVVFNWLDTAVPGQKHPAKRMFE